MVFDHGRPKAESECATPRAVNPLRLEHIRAQVLEPGIDHQSRDGRVRTEVLAELDRHNDVPPEAPLPVLKISEQHSWRHSPDSSSVQAPIDE